MNLAELRETVGLSPEESTSDALLSALLRRAEAFGRLFCHLRSSESLPAHLLVQMAAEDYGRLEGAGLSSRTLSGAAEKYLGTYSEGTLTQLRALRHPAGRTERKC